jgi:hypothetical protein
MPQVMPPEILNPGPATVFHRYLKLLSLVERTVRLFITFAKTSALGGIAFSNAPPITDAQHMAPNENANSPGRPDMSRVCSPCGETVARHDCHKNRYGEYICRKCQRAGIKFTWRQRLRQLRKWTPPAFLLYLAIVTLVMWLLYRVFNS